MAETECNKIVSHCENVWVTLCLWSKLSKLKLNQATSCSKPTNNDLRHPDFIVLRLHSSYRHRVGCRGDTMGLVKTGGETVSPDSWAGSTLNLVITSRMWRAAVMGAGEFHRLSSPSVINCHVTGEWRSRQPVETRVRLATADIITPSRHKLSSRENIFSHRRRKAAALFGFRWPLLQCYKLTGWP